jgi:hypothetical protein
MRVLSELKGDSGAAFPIEGKSYRLKEAEALRSEPAPAPYAQAAKIAPPAKAGRFRSPGRTRQPRAVPQPNNFAEYAPFYSAANRSHHGALPDLDCARREPRSLVRTSHSRQGS